MIKVKENNEILIDDKSPEQFSRSSRFFIYMILLLLSIIMHSDNMKNDLQLNQITFNIFSSLGRIIGICIFIKISQIENRKKVTLICFYLCGLLYFNYFFTCTHWILYFTKFLTSGLKIYPIIFIPAWVDQFGIKKYKTFFMILFSLYYSSPIIIFILSSINKSDKWYYNYMIVGLLIIAINSLLLSFPSKYFSINYNFVGYKRKGKKGFYKNANIENENGSSSFFANEEKEETDLSFLNTIIKNKIYIFSVLTKASYYLVIPIIKNNFKNYVMFFIGNLENIKKQSFLFSTFELTLFFLRLFCFMTLCCIGGYENNKTSIVLKISSIITFFCSLIIVYTNINIIFIMAYALFLSFSEILIIIINCYIVNSLKNKYKSSGVSLGILISNIMSFFGPILYGFLNSKLSKKSKTLPWKIIAHLYIFVLIFSLILASYKYKSLNNERKENNDKEQELKNFDDN